MNHFDSEELCRLINQQNDQLTFHYKEQGPHQSLAITDFEAVRFPRSAGGGVAGGSAAWIRGKHKDGGIHEPGMVAALATIASTSPSIKTVYDIGSLYGYFSLIARSMFPMSEVHAFEVNPNSYAALKNNIAANTEAFGDSIVAHHCALSDISATQSKLRVNAFNVKLATEKPESAESRPVHDIDVWSLEDFCKNASSSPDLIKIDVEGYQAKIIPGAMAVILKSRPIILLEFDDQDSCNNFGVTNKEVIKPLMKEGYKLIWGMHRTGGRFETLDWNDMTDDHEVNSLGILTP